MTRVRLHVCVSEMLMPDSSGGLTRSCTRTSERFHWHSNSGTTNFWLWCIVRGGRTSFSGMYKHYRFIMRAVFPVSCDWQAIDTLDLGPGSQCACSLGIAIKIRLLCRSHLWCLRRFSLIPFAPLSVCKEQKQECVIIIHAVTCRLFGTTGVGRRVRLGVVLLVW